MKKSPELSALSVMNAVARKSSLRSSLHILRCGIIDAEGARVRVTTLDHELVLANMPIPAGVKFPALFDLPLYVRTGDLPAAVSAAAADPYLKVDEFPGMVKGIGACSGRLPAGLATLIPSLAVDESRHALNLVCCNAKKGEAVATDGHTLFLRNFDNPCFEKSFLISSLALKVAECFADLPSVYVADDSRVTFKGAGWWLSYRGEEYIAFPEYKKVIPDYRKLRPVVWTAADRAAIYGYIQKVLPFYPRRDFCPMFFSETAAYVRIKSIGYSSDNDFQTSIFPVKNKLIKFDARLFMKVIEYFGHKGKDTGDTIVQVGTNPCNVALFRSADKSRRAILMPLRVLSGTEGDVWQESADIDKKEEIAGFGNT